MYKVVSNSKYNGECVFFVTDSLKEALQVAKNYNEFMADCKTATANVFFTLLINE